MLKFFEGAKSCSISPQLTEFSLLGEHFRQLSPLAQVWKRRRWNEKREILFSFPFFWFAFCSLLLKINSAYTLFPPLVDMTVWFEFLWVKFSPQQSQKLSHHREKQAHIKTEMKSQITHRLVTLKLKTSFYSTIWTFSTSPPPVSRGSKINFFNFRHVTSRLGVAGRRRRDFSPKIWQKVQDVCQLSLPRRCLCDSIFDSN